MGQGAAVAGGVRRVAGAATRATAICDPAMRRAQMIGRETRESRVVLPAGDQTVLHELALPVLALPLAGIEVAASARCALRREEGEATLAVWNEARKALEVAAWSLETEIFRYRLELRTREYGLEERIVRVEKREVLSGYYREPFVSRPAADSAWVVGGGVLAGGTTTRRDLDAALILAASPPPTHIARR